MKKIFSLIILSLMVVSLIGIASAITCSQQATTVGGTIYQEDITNFISGASVEVICNHDGIDYTETTTSGSYGEYSVLFNEYECVYGDQVTVNAQSNGLIGTNQGIVSMTYDLGCLTLNVGIVNVPLVPEFGIFVGLLTILSAFGVFFIIRKD